MYLRVSCPGEGSGNAAQGRGGEASFGEVGAKVQWSWILKMGLRVAKRTKEKSLRRETPVWNMTAFGELKQLTKSPNGQVSRKWSAFPCHCSSCSPKQPQVPLTFLKIP